MERVAPKPKRKTNKNSSSKGSKTKSLDPRDVRARAGQRLNEKAQKLKMTQITVRITQDTADKLAEFAHKHRQTINSAAAELLQESLA